MTPAATMSLLAFVPRVFRKEQPAQHDKPNDDPDDGKPSADFIHELLKLHEGSSKRLSGKAAASEDGEAYVFWHVEPLSDARTKPATFFKIL